MRRVSRMLKKVEDMTIDELIKEMKNGYLPSEHSIWRFEDITRELEARNYTIEEYHTIEAEKKEMKGKEQLDVQLLYDTIDKFKFLLKKIEEENSSGDYSQDSVRRAYRWFEKELKRILEPISEESNKKSE